MHMSSICLVSRGRAGVCRVGVGVEGCEVVWALKSYHQQCPALDRPSWRHVVRIDPGKPEAHTQLRNCPIGLTEAHMSGAQH